MTRVTLVSLAALLLASACAPAPATPAPAPVFPAGTIVDLSHSYGEDTVFWPTADPFRLEVVAAGMTDAGYYYAANTFATAEHGGTHIDAPLHFAEGRQAVDEIPLENLVGPAVVVDVSAAADANPDYLVAVADFEAFESTHGVIPSGSLILIRTGFSSRWPDAARYLGTAERGEAAVPLLHFPGIDPAAARWLVANRRPHAVGIDTASIDFGQSTTYESHRILYEANIPGLENLTALERLPPTGAYLVALPMKIAGGSGAPLRAIAIVPPR
jgi:kynurenine formamidase